MIRLLALIAALALPAMSVGAQGLPDVRAAADQERIAVGDRVTFTVTVRHEPGSEVFWPAIADTLGPFELVGSQQVEPEIVDSVQISSIHYWLTAFELGELEIPAIELQVSDPGGGEPVSRVTDPTTIDVVSVGIDESGDIRAVKAPLEIPRNWLLLLPWALLVLAVAGLGYWAYRKFRSREKTLEYVEASRIPERPPHEVAHEALDRLEAKHLPEKGAIKEFFIEVSEIVRAYIEARYPIDALEMTSYEVLSELQRVGLDSVQYRLFPPFFERSDLVKFAKYRPQLEACNEMLPMARRLIDATKERPVVDAAQEETGQVAQTAAASAPDDTGTG